MEPWHALWGDGGDPFDPDTGEDKRPAEIAALHVIVVGAPLDPEHAPTEAPVVRYFDDEDSGDEVRSDGDDDDVWERLEHQHYVFPPAEE